jgi:signal transduction histidine kinase
MEAIASFKQRLIDARLRAIEETPAAEVEARRQRAIDWFWVLLSFGLAIAMIAGGGLGPPEHDQRGLDALGVLLAAGMSLPLLARRRAPLPVFVVVMAALAVLGGLRYPPDVTLGPAVALFTLANSAGREVPSRVAVAVALGAFVAVAAALMIGYDELLGPEILFIGAVWVALWLGGRGHRLKAEHIRALEERTERAEREAERERRLAAAEERTRIARDLHDSAGHAINVILVEAGAARLLRERDPERAEQALETIEQVAREQIDEIDRLVQRLRAEDTGVDPIDRQMDMTLPAGVPPGPQAAEQLFERMRASGLELEVERLGKQGVLLGPVVGRGTYRILQEALTNAQRHGSGSALVRATFRDEEVEFLVENPTNGEPQNGEGHGLLGMRERVELLGGRLEAGASNGTFRVQVTLPYDCEFDPTRFDPKRFPPHEHR